MTALRWMWWTIRAAPQIVVAYVTGETDTDLPDTPRKGKSE